MKIGPKYKIARRLGAPIFEKTQSQKFKLSAQPNMKMGKKKQGPRSEYGKQLIEKQKARFTYGITEKQFKKYVTNSITKSQNPQESLFISLEKRLDNVVSRLGLVSTRRFARQVVSHGHICVNGRKVTIPSYEVRPGDEISIRPGSAKNSIFKSVDEKVKDAKSAGWVTWNMDKASGSILRDPTLQGQDLLFDLAQVIEYYKRS